VRDYNFKRLTARQMANKRKPLCEFGTGITNGTQINLCRKPASYLVYWPEKAGKMCTTPAYGCEACKAKLSEPPTTNANR